MKLRRDMLTADEKKRIDDAYAAFKGETVEMLEKSGKTTSVPHTDRMAIAVYKFENCRDELQVKYGCNDLDGDDWPGCSIKP